MCRAYVTKVSAFGNWISCTGSGLMRKKTKRSTKNQFEKGTKSRNNRWFKQIFQSRISRDCFSSQRIKLDLRFTANWFWRNNDCFLAFREETNSSPWVYGQNIVTSDIMLKTTWTAQLGYNYITNMQYLLFVNIGFLHLSILFLKDL